jgi:hypothetical protein
MTDFEHIGHLIHELLKQGLVYQSPWLPPRLAARYCHLSESHLNSLRSKGKGPRYVKRARRVLYYCHWLDQWLLKGKSS